MTARRHAIPAGFGRRLQRERENRGWTLRDAGGKCGLAANSVLRAEKGYGVALSSAITLAALYGVSLDVLLAEAVCETCDGMPPAGFICSACGRGTSLTPEINPERTHQ